MGSILSIEKREPGSDNAGGARGCCEVPNGEMPHDVGVR
jgi:hypothetical protein